MEERIEARMQELGQDIQDFYDQYIWAYVRACRIGGMDVDPNNQEQVWEYIAQQVEEIWLPMQNMSADDIDNGGDTEVEWNAVIEWCNNRSWDLLGWEV